MCDEKSLLKISPSFNGQKGISITIPLKTGTIGSIIGFDEVKKLEQVVDYTHYYEIGDSIDSKKLNTLDQLFARIMIVSGAKANMYETLKKIRNMVSVKDINGTEMIIWTTFDKLLSKYSV